MATRCRHRFTPFVAVVLSVVATVAAADPATAPVARQGGAGFVLALYPLAAPRDDFRAQLNAACARDFPDIRVLERIAGHPKDVICCSFVPAKASDFPPPSDEALKYFGRGIDDAQRQRLGRCQAVFALIFAAPRGLAPRAVDEANRLALSLAEANDALIWDEATRELFSPAAWKEKRVAPLRGGRVDARSQIAIHMYRREAQSGLVREITLGMQKFACPDVVVEDITATAAIDMGNLINVVCQHLIEAGGPLPGDAKSVHVDLSASGNEDVRRQIEQSLQPGATKVADLAVAPAARDEGDPDNALLALTFDAGPAGLTPQERQIKTLSTFFGSRGSEVINVRTGDPEMTAARDRARAKLPQKADEFRKGLPAGERLMVKAPFRSTDGSETEYMWVEVIGWQGDQITGTLNSRPRFPSDYRPGSRVTVRQADVFDYCHVRRDGSIDGNETNDILERRQGKRQ